MTDELGSCRQFGGGGENRAENKKLIEGDSRDAVINPKAGVRRAGGGSEQIIYNDMLRGSGFNAPR